jgi:hypothetical protein
MPIIARKKSGEYSTAPEGLWQAVCCDVVDLGEVETQWGNKPMVRICWIIEEVDPKTGMNYLVSQRYTLSLHEKSRLRPMLEAWRSRKFTDEELEGFDLEKLIGVNCQVQVIHNLSSQGGTFANVQAVVPAGRSAAKMTVPETYIRVCDREDKESASDDRTSEITDEDVPF